MSKIICLPVPSALQQRLHGRDKKIRESLQYLARYQLSKLEELADLTLPPNSKSNEEEVKLCVEKHDLYDEYFNVKRSTENPADELGFAFVSSLISFGEEAKRGYNIDPLAVSALLRGIQVQAKVMLEEAYYD